MGGGTDPHGPGRAGRLIGDETHDPPPLEAGTVVTLRETWLGRTLALRPVRVVEDVPRQHRAFYLSLGSRWLNDPRDHGEVRFLDVPWELERAIAQRHVLSFAFPDTPYAVLLSWTAEWDFRGYYVNIESPLRIAADRALEYTDWFLDVRIPPTLDRYEWKDEHELEEAVARGILTPAEALDVRWAGERAIEHVLMREPPFDQDWLSWRPDPWWGPLDLPGEALDGLPHHQRGQA